MLGCCFNITGPFLFTFDIILNIKGNFQHATQTSKHFSALLSVIIKIMSSMHIITPELCNSPLQASECCSDIMGLFPFNLDIILNAKPQSSKGFVLLP